MVTAGTADKQVQVIRYFKKPGGGNVGKVQTVIKNLTDRPLSVTGVWNVFECGDPCPRNCPDCRPSTIDGRSVRLVGKWEGTQVVPPREISRGSAFDLSQ